MIKLNSPLNVQIETGNYCNRKCSYCYWGHTKEFEQHKVMPMDIFLKIISEIKTLGVGLQPIAFAAYNEPTIDPFFLRRLSILKASDIRYWNITNGTNLTAPIVEYFLNNLDLICNFIVINIPSIDPIQYQTYGGGTPNQLRITKNGLHMLGPYVKPRRLNAHISVLGALDETHKTNFETIKDEFEKYGYTITQSQLSDRAGTLNPYVNNNIYHEKVKTCYKFAGNLYFGIEGNVYLCCHDFRKVYSYGNINDKPLKDIIGSQEHLGMIEKMKSEICKRCNEATI